MNWIAPTVLALQILLLLYVAVIDIATRLIHNEICLIAGAARDRQPIRRSDAYRGIADRRDHPVSAAARRL